MIFRHTFERDDGEHAVTVRASVQPYADAVDAPAEFRSRLAGRGDVEILEVTEDATGKAFATTDEEHEQLAALAAQRAPGERDAHEMSRAGEGED